MIRAVFFDIDGTIVSKKDMKIPPSFKVALQKLKDRGIYTGIASGRHTIEIKEQNLLQDLSFDFYVTLNGGLCYEKNHLVYSQALCQDDVQQLLALSNQHQIPLLLIEKDKMYLNQINDAVRKAQAAIHTAIPPVQKVPSPLPSFYQICIFPNPEEISLCRPLKKIQMTQWHDFAFDLIPSTGSKTEGIKAVLAPYHISLKEVACFGDGDNDADMLEACGLGICMGESSLKAKKASIDQTATVEEDGIYKALCKYQII